MYISLQKSKNECSKSQKKKKTNIIFKRIKLKDFLHIIASSIFTLMFFNFNFTFYFLTL